jgi:hypothetical protein
MTPITVFLDLHSAASQAAFAQLPQQLQGLSVVLRYQPLPAHEGGAGTADSALLAWRHTRPGLSPSRWVCERLLQGLPLPEAPHSERAGQAALSQALAQAQQLGVHELPAVHAVGRVFAGPNAWADLAEALRPLRAG